MTNPLVDYDKKVHKLISAAHQHDKIILGVDFDFTLYASDNSYADKTFYDDILGLVLEAQNSQKCIMCLWTASSDLPTVLGLTKEVGLKWDYINESPLTFSNPPAKKPHFNLLLDDAAGLGESVQILTEFLHRMKDPK